MEQFTSKIHIQVEKLDIKAENIQQESLTQILDYAQSYQNFWRKQSMKTEKALNVQNILIGIFIALGLFGITVYLKSEAPQEHRIDITN